ncbi:retinol dehydrogenase [Coniella lustricola]|uniref:Retinol dehydrogenase n=1 Tax=Coniella lustricola TaxID=2025994 RepID=A0A2T2ZUB5_9PEZI|nr:retinol dehydrogenase [Coniella lustricola]
MGFLYSQFFKTPAYPTASFTGKTVIITGSNTGLGKEAARHVVRLGAQRLILAVRSLDKGQAAKLDIAGGTTTADIQVWQLDMASYDSVQRFAARVNSELDRVDHFVANAGVASFNYETAEDNEHTITVNVISTFLLLALVLPKMKETAAAAAATPTRPVFTVMSSGAHTHTSFPQRTAPKGKLLETINDEQEWAKHPGEQYPLSKLLEIFLVRAIAERCPAPQFPVTINAADPGLCHSELAREAVGLQKVAFDLFKTLIARSTEVGSRTEVNAVAAGVETHGQYVVDSCEIPKMVPLIADGKELQDRIAEEVFAKLDAIVPGVTGNFSLA